jgi:hypothetical protein
MRAMPHSGWQLIQTGLESVDLKEYALYEDYGLKLLLIAALLVFLFNIPFGYWRSRVCKFSVPWLLAIHIPVPFVIGCRLFLGLGWHLITFPILAGAFLAGQLMGSKVRNLF